MKVFENIEESDYRNKDALKRVVGDLIPIRKDKEATGSYYDTYLNADFRLDVAKHRAIGNNGEFIAERDFKLNLGEIPPKEAIEFREALFNVIEEDKESFGYLYRLLGQDINRRMGYVYCTCLIPDDDIKFCVDFDIDLIRKEIGTMDDRNDKIKRLNEWRDNCVYTKYNGRFKADFLEKINYALTYLPDKEAALPFLTRVITQREQQFLFDKLVNNKFISCDYESFCFAFGGTKTDNFKPIVWLKNNKQSLRDLLKELKSANMSINETMKNADLYFTDDKGNKLKLPEKDRKHEDSYDEELMKNILIDFRRLQKSATS